ncbi:hypothetical protein SOCE26_029830 [Sorangium cellulosum]|uniref:Uncharacterized protein n=1 Tax=Sorangium cellulosum TaxID=56 RepID=A0A2L0EQN1_SORCE|nr:hypothetical protein [Sorangium cellulosum]AUX41562.1 hypothetical protein SOCE26_029830 [Sorangium cellulosum]
MELPGRADDLSPELRERWRDYVDQVYARLRPSYPSRFFRRSPSDLKNPVPLQVRWFADPLEPKRCLGEEAARKLCDWAVEGRYTLHDEYCEYHVTYGVDAEGRMRPKRVDVSTELREYWVLVAEHDPRALLAMATDVLGFEPRWRDLYGVADPLSLSPRARRLRFARQVAGSGNLDDGVPSQPVGALNREHLLFMAVSVNGVDDIFFIHMFGSRLYSVKTPEGLRPATRDEIFLQRSRPDLACRNSDPEAALTAQDAVQKGRPITFADPLGIYIHTFAREKFSYKDDVLPERWVRFRRGQEGMFQRLEIGPGDDEPAFLDDVLLHEGARARPVTGGYQILRNVEVGPLMMMGEPEPVLPEDHVLLEPGTETIQCAQGAVCATIRALKERYDAAHKPRTGTRGGPGGGHG